MDEDGRMSEKGSTLVDSQFMFKKRQMDKRITQREVWLDQKILFYTQSEGDYWKKFPFDMTRREFNAGTYELKPTTIEVQVLATTVTGLCIIIQNIPCFKLAFEDGSVLALDYMPQYNLKNWKIGGAGPIKSLSEPDREENHLEYLKRTLL
jgi:hypothetical protein